MTQYRVLQREPRVGDLVRVVNADEGEPYKNGDIGTLVKRDHSILPFRIKLGIGEEWVHAHEVEFIEEVPVAERTYTTGEIIVELKPGQRAYSQGLNEMIYCDSLAGTIRSMISHDYIPLTPAYINATWTIVPEYVNFTTAFRACRSGKSIMREGCSKIWNNESNMFTAADIESNKWIILD